MSYLESVKSDASCNPYFMGYKSLPYQQQKEIGGALLSSLNVCERASIYQKTSEQFKRNLGSYSKLLFKNCMGYLEESQFVAASGGSYQEEMPF